MAEYEIVSVIDNDMPDIATYPMFLRKDILAWQEGIKTNSRLLDCLYCELQASINGAFYDNAITEEQADYMRKTYLGMEWGNLYEF